MKSRVSKFVATLAATALLTALAAVFVAPAASATSFDPKQVSSGTAKATTSKVQPRVSGQKIDGHWSMGSSSSGNHIFTNFSTRYTVANWSTFVRIDSGFAYSSWQGSGRGSVKLVDHIWATGIGITVSAPGGASGSIVNQSVDFPASASNANIVSNSYSGAEFSGPILSINENANARWTISGSTYSLITN